MNIWRIFKVIYIYIYIFTGMEYKFSSGGREDIDVRMLGSGRPFVIEIISPKRIFFN